MGCTQQSISIDCRCRQRVHQQSETKAMSGASSPLDTVLHHRGSTKYLSIEHESASSRKTPPPQDGFQIRGNSRRTSEFTRSLNASMLRAARKSLPINSSHHGSIQNGWVLAMLSVDGSLMTSPTATLASMHMPLQVY